VSPNPEAFRSGGPFRRAAQQPAGSREPRSKQNKTSLFIAITKLNPAFGKKRNQKIFAEILDEVTCYIERTIQLFWLNYKIGMFSPAKVSENSVIFRLFHQAKDQYKLQMIKLKHRLKLSSYLLMQLSP